MYSMIAASFFTPPIVSSAGKNAPDLLRESVLDLRSICSPIAVGKCDLRSFTFIHILRRGTPSQWKILDLKSITFVHIVRRGLPCGLMPLYLPTLY